MEFESVREGSNQYAEENNNLNLKKNGIVIKNTAFDGRSTKFLDMRKPETIEHLDKILIKFLKDNGIGYLKMDYNASIIGCDDGDSLGQGLIDHMQGLYDFLKRLKKERPDIIIENCAAGGSRLDPKMMSVTAIESYPTSL